MNCMPPTCIHVTKTVNIPWKSSKWYVHLEKQISMSSLQGIAVQTWEIFISATWIVPLLQGNWTKFTTFYDFGCKVCLALFRSIYLWHSLEPNLLFRDVRETPLSWDQIRFQHDGGPVNFSVYVLEFLVEICGVSSGRPIAGIFLDLIMKFARLWNNEWRSIV